MPDNIITQVSEVGGKVTVNKVEIVGASPVPEVYANHVQPAITSFDVSIHFGSIMGFEKDTLQIVRRVTVVLSPEVAKMLMLHLKTGLERYEQSVRPIPVQFHTAPVPQDSPTTE
jgi:hypothetical protein